MPQLQRSPGRHATRRIDEPRGLPIARHEPGVAAEALAEAHNVAVRTYGSDSGGFHAFDPTTNLSADVWDGQGGFPTGTVVTRLAWGRIDARTAQRILEADRAV